MIIRSIPGSYTVFSHSYDDIYLNSNRFIPVYISDGDKLIIGNSVYVYCINIAKNGKCISGWFDSCGNYTNVQIPKNKSFYLFSKTGCKIAINNSKKSGMVVLGSQRTSIENKEKFVSRVRK